MHKKIGHWSFIVGVALAVLAGLLQLTNAYVALVLVVLGVLVGFLNITHREVTEFLVASIALLAAGSANLILLNTVVSPLGTVLHAVLTQIKVFVAPAAVIVALKAVHKLATD